MSTFLHDGHRTWGLQVDQDGHRTYNISFLTEGGPRDGPANHVQTPGLPLFGDIWVVDDDIDIWAWFRAGPTGVRDMTFSGTPKKGANDNSLFEITYTASTRPGDMSAPGGSGGKDDKGARKKCSDQRIEDPLSEPPSTSGSSLKYQREEEFSKDGKPFRYTSFEKILGQFREFDAHREQVVVEANVLNLDRSLVLSLMDKLNDAALWDMPPRCWKLCDWGWQRKLYGTCAFYYTRRLTFESNAIEVPVGSNLYNHPVFFQWLVNGPDGKWWLPMWDHYVLDESSKVLNGKWSWVFGDWVDVPIPSYAGSPNPNPDLPHHYIFAKDREQQPCRLVLSRTNKGRPATNEDDSNWIRLQKHPEANLLVLGMPTTL